MSRDPAIEIESLWKLFQLPRAADTPPGGLDALGAHTADAPDDIAVREGRAFWALRDINLTIKRGEVVGIIGRNGAGKSTLLKVLSRVTGPTRGRVRVHGSLVSLLEVGSGFHDELTGRENISLNATILGMSAAELNRKFNQIVDFSGIGNFIDMPVKHMSSGMRARLGFSIAVHVEPDILIVDEILAVGDAEFKEKCRARVAAIMRAQDRAVLVVSHSLGQIENLCSRVVVLEQGAVTAEGAVEETIQYYLNAIRTRAGVEKITTRDTEPSGAVASLSQPFTSASGLSESAVPPSDSIITTPVSCEADHSTTPPPPAEHLLKQHTRPVVDELKTWNLQQRTNRSGDGRLRFTGLVVRDSGGRPAESIAAGEAISFEIVYSASKDIIGPREGSFAIGINDEQRNRVFSLLSRLVLDGKLMIAKTGSLTCRLLGLPLLPGTYTLDLGCTIEGVVADRIKSAGLLDVCASNFYPTGRFPDSTQGRALLHYQWHEGSVVPHEA